MRQLDLPPPNIPTKQSRSEIDDKFCKFEIKKLIEGNKYKFVIDIYKDMNNILFAQYLYLIVKLVNIIFIFLF